MKRLLLILAVLFPCLSHGQPRYPNYFSTNQAPFNVVPAVSMYVPVFYSTNGVFTNLTVTDYLFIGTAQVNFLQMLGNLNQQGADYTNFFQARSNYFRGFLAASNLFGLGLSVEGQSYSRSVAFPVITADRTSVNTATAVSALGVRQTTTGNMADGFGAGLTFQIQDSANVTNAVVMISGDRDGADDSGVFVVRTYLAGVSTEKLRVNSAGNVGIGTNNPQAKLHVNSPTGDALSLDVEATGTGIQIKRSGTNFWKIYQSSPNQDALIFEHNATGSPITLGPDGSFSGSVSSANEALTAYTVVDADGDNVIDGEARQFKNSAEGRLVLRDTVNSRSYAVPYVQSGQTNAIGLTSQVYLLPVEMPSTNYSVGLVGSSPLVNIAVTLRTTTSFTSTMTIFTGQIQWTIVEQNP